MKEIVLEVVNISYLDDIRKTRSEQYEEQVRKFMEVYDVIYNRVSDYNYYWNQNARCVSVAFYNKVEVEQVIEEKPTLLQRINKLVFE